MEEKDRNFGKLAEIARSLGAAAFGVADLAAMKRDGHAVPTEECDGYGRGISVGFRLSDSVMEGIKDGPTRPYRYHYRQVNAHLDRIALQLTAHIQLKGDRAMPIGSSHVIDWENNRGELSHKWVAYYAGLGWFGRNNLLVHPTYGSRMRYVTVLTDMPLATGKPHEGDCAECFDCMEVCPAGAISEKRDDFRLDLCSEKLDFFKKKWNIGQQICGVCIKACVGLERRGVQRNKS